MPSRWETCQGKLSDQGPKESSRTSADSWFPDRNLYQTFRADARCTRPAWRPLSNQQGSPVSCAQGQAPSQDQETWHTVDWEHCEGAPFASTRQLHGVPAPFWGQTPGLQGISQVVYASSLVLKEFQNTLGFNKVQVTIVTIIKKLNAGVDIFE